MRNDQSLNQDYYQYEIGIMIETKIEEEKPEKRQYPHQRKHHEPMK